MGTLRGFPCPPTMVRRRRRGCAKRGAGGAGCPSRSPRRGSRRAPHATRSAAKLLALGCALFAATAAWAESPPAPDASAQSTEATFAEAVRLFKAGDAAAALPLFIRLSAVTDSPNVQLYVGYCQLELGDNREAHEAFSLAAKQSIELGGSKYVATREAALDQLDKLNLRLARLTISLADAPAEFVVKLDTQTVNSTLLGTPIIVEPGLHHVEAESQGADPVSRAVTLDRGGNQTITISFKPSNKPPTEERAGSSSPRLISFGLATAGLAVVGWGTFAVAGLLAKNAHDQLQADCPNGCSDADHRGQINRGKTYQTVANLGLAVGVVGAVTGAALIYLGWPSNNAARASLEVAPGLVKISYRGSFSW